MASRADILANTGEGATETDRLETKSCLEDGAKVTSPRSPLAVTSDGVTAVPCPGPCRKSF